MPQKGVHLEANILTAIRNTNCVTKSKEIGKLEKTQRTPFDSKL